MCEEKVFRLAQMLFFGHFDSFTRIYYKNKMAAYYRDKRGPSPATESISSMAGIIFCSPLISRCPLPLILIFGKRDQNLEF
jgi:hypothetical protein